VLRYLLVTGFVVGLAWICFALPIGGRTLFGHARRIGVSKMDSALARIKVDLDERIKQRDVQRARLAKEAPAPTAPTPRKSKTGRRVDPRTERTERTERSERGDRSERSERSERIDKPAPPQPDRPAEDAEDGAMARLQQGTGSHVRPISRGRRTHVDEHIPESSERAIAELSGRSR
jgi:hypothetical protein